MIVPRAARVAAAVACLTTLTALAACGGGGGGGQHGAQPSASPPGTGSTPGAPPINPLTGGAPSRNAAVAVKIDDTGNGRPQVGIDAADLVYVEQVEGGLTRLLAVYTTKLPTVEPVRSTRVGDPDLALQFGPIDYVASGGSDGELAPLDKSPLRSSIGDRGGPGFDRDPNRGAPFNLRADLAAIAAKLKGPRTKSIGLTWSRHIANTASGSGARVATTVGGTPVAFTWSGTRHRYVRMIDDTAQHAADGALISTPNVVVQACPVTTFMGDIDQGGNPAKVTHTVGRGKVSVFRDGKRIDGTWSRASTADGTHLTDPRGQPIALAPGGAWFVLVATGTPTS
jgi:hypothetical protein